MPNFLSIIPDKELRKFNNNTSQSHTFRDPYLITPKALTMSQVNLDALIPREDLEIKDTKQSAKQTPGINISNLKKGELFMESLRKPQFQRSTLEWTPDKVYKLVKSFTNGDLIPAIILWKGDGNNFVIDGAHRLSALIAWVNNDYGIGNASTAYFGINMERGQKEKAKEVKKLIEDDIGTYEDILWAGKNQSIALKDKVEIAQRISSLSLDLQWVPGNASQAEDSFFRINESASPLDGTEKRLLKARNKPMAIAARAIVRSGGGHKYWGKFSQGNQEKIEEVATELHDWLFKPELETPIKTMDIALAGKGYSDATQELILNVVNFSNNIKIVDASRIKKSEEFPENGIPDETSDGIETINYLINTRKMLANVTGKLSSSLGLHPAIYCYSKQGRYQITPFMAILPFVKEYEEKKQLINFTIVRKNFEEFLWKHKNLINQATNIWGSGAKGYLNFSKLFKFIVELLLNNNSEEDVLKALDTNADYNFFKPGVRTLKIQKGKDFSNESKSEVYMREGVENILRCFVCGAYLHKNSITIDHDDEKEKGGAGNPENGKLVHPYCNSIKAKLKELGFIKPTASFVS